MNNFISVLVAPNYYKTISKDSIAIVEPTSTGAKLTLKILDDNGKNVVLNVLTDYISIDNALHST